MSHKHWCDFAGHEWECEGTALRVFAGDTEPSVCMCAIHRVPFEEGDHSQCEMELIACPEHHEEQLRAMGYEPGQVPERPPTSESEESSLFKDEDGNPIVGFCLWCNQNFYSMDEVEVHNADDMAACAVFQELKDQDCGPPVLQMMFDQKPNDEEEE